MRALSGYFLAGALASSALPPIGFVPALFFLAWPAYHLASAPNQRAALFIGTAMGLGWFVASTHWTAHSLLVGDAKYWYLLPVAAIGVPAILTCFWSVAGALAWQVARTRQGRLLWLLAALSLAEFGRGFIATGFPWNAPGYAFSVSLASLQSASWFGLYGLNLFAIGMALAPAFWKLDNRNLAIIAVIAPLILTGAGLYRLASADDVVSGNDAAKTIRMVQPNIEQKDKWDRDQRADNLAGLVALSVGEKPVPQLVIWPETAFTGFLDSNAGLLRETAIAATPFDGHLITGILRLAGKNRLHNSAILIDGSGDVQAIYDKHHLVPFGEFAPFRDWLPFVDVIAGPVDFSPGGAHQLFDIPGYGLVQMSICYESIFPGAVIIGDTRPDMIINITNDGWFGRTLGPWQHLAQAQMRAVEEGMAMVRVANTGVSAMFGPYGHMLGEIKHGERGAIDVAVPRPIAPPLFVSLRHVLFLLTLSICAILAWRLDVKATLRQ